MHRKRSSDGRIGKTADVQPAEMQQDHKGDFNVKNMHKANILRNRRADLALSAGVSHGRDAAANLSQRIGEWRERLPHRGRNRHAGHDSRLPAEPCSMNTPLSISANEDGRRKRQGRTRRVQIPGLCERRQGRSTTGGSISRRHIGEHRCGSLRHPGTSRRAG